MKTELWAIALVFVATIIGSFGSLLLKKGADRLKFRFWKLVKNWRLILGLFLFVFSSVFFIASLRGGEISVLYPITSLTYIWIALLSIKYLKEKMNSWKWSGILFIVIGVALIGFGY